MAASKQWVRYSKLLSLVLRHRPDMLGLQPDAGGWVPVKALLQGLQQQGYAIDEALLVAVVAHNNKQRFAISTDGCQIRASQGHSIPVTLDYTPQVPPPVLYHGTAGKFIAPILQQGLHKGRRHHVHLSTDMNLAKTVGSRHGKPVVLHIDAARMHADGYVFYQSPNGVWLADAVPPPYLRVITTH